MRKIPTVDEEQDELEIDLDEELNGYRPLDFDDNSLYDRRLAPSLEEELDILLDVLEDEEAKDEIDEEEALIEQELTTPEMEE